MPTAMPTDKKLPRRFGDLVAMMPPQAILDEAQYENTLAVVDRLMAAGRLNKGQALYLETLVQLVEAYESAHHAIDVSGASGLDTLRHLLAEHGMTASDLARLLGVHPSMGSKILKGHRSLTVPHMRRLARHFGVAASLFLE